MNFKINYSEGTCFLVPLRGGGFCRGLVSRYDGYGRILGYFFGPKIVTKNFSFEAIQPDNAVFIGRCGDLGLIKGEWHICGGLDRWDREYWPVPLFYREDKKANKAWLSSYDDNLSLLAETPIEVISNPSYPSDGLWGSGAAEIRLTKLLEGKR